MQIDAAGLLTIGERIWNLQKFFNIKRGFGRSDDTLPARLLIEPLQEGGPVGQVWRGTKSSSFWPAWRPRSRTAT
jgi:aldehyde:ferredoxin oxidoreductase